ncbi:NlpC/P60 family protein [Rhodobacter aestuarii]|uniref:NlpC/P60 family protein n=1 Tax=Rhodobacter aestuarii TaxID=453582 RepID=A0A1N7MQY2_9RHOB|nr:NlpC/P60 family protein [Rhodobacter aestuarii]PTV96610.1 NlpC/P60 family protein [Rhodobacter aestuarii]SIS88279.1 NlpC/P60 family protein [Rhodobacter aestuarii]
MSDARLSPFSGRFALETLHGQVEAEAFVPGEPARIGSPVVDLSTKPEGGRDRQLLYGAEVVVIERRGESAFVQAQADGYCGWITALALAPPSPATHVVVTRGTHLYREASIKRGEHGALSLGARLTVLDQAGDLARTPEGWVPARHLRPIDLPETDPVSVAERLLGTPYLWGGNASFGIDCSGLVQLAYALCHRACPGDSDLQRAAFGDFLPEDTSTQRGDLFFWAGHIAIAVSPDLLLHANGHAMAVVYEPIDACLARIAASGEARWFGRKRPV